MAETEIGQKNNGEEKPSVEKVKKQKLERVERPNQNAFDSQMDELSREMKSLQDKVDQHNSKLSEIRNLQKAARAAIEAERAKVAPQRNARSRIRADRKKLYDQKDAATARIESKRAQADKMKEGLRYTRVDQIEAEISRLEYKHSTEHMSLQKEKALVKEIEQLRKSRKTVAAYFTFVQSTKSDEILVRELRAAIRNKSQEIAKLDAEINAATQGQNKHAKNLKNDDYSKISSQIRELRTAITKKRQKMGKLRSEFRKKKDLYYAYERQEREARNALRREEEKIWLAQQELERKKREEELAKQKPWLAEMGACDMLIEFLRPRLPKVAKQEKKKEAGDGTITLLDGTVVKPLAKKCGEDYVGIGGRLGKDGRRGYGKKSAKQRNKGGFKDKSLKLSPDLLVTFSVLQLRPPRRISEIANSISELEAKKAYFDCLPRAPKKETEKEDKPETVEKAEAVRERVDSIATPDAEEAVDAEMKAAAKAAEAAAAAAVAAEVEAKAEQDAAEVDAGVKAEIKNLIESNSLTEGAEASAAAVVSIPVVGSLGEFDPFTTYDDDAALGKYAPTLDSLKLLNCEPGTSAPSLQGGKHTLVLFWAKYLKDNCFPMLQAANDFLAKDFDIQVIAVATDPEVSQVERFITKGECPCNFPLGYDADWKVKNAFQDLISADGTAIQVPQAFIVSPQGKVVWRQAFSKARPYSGSNFSEQLRRVLAGEELQSSGMSPKSDEAEVEEVETECFAPPPKAADDIW
eukprot:g542.t1